MSHSSSNKWLLRKASGSRAKYKHKGDYADDKEQIADMYDDLPQHEAVRRSRSYLDTTLVKRWLYSKVGCDFDDVFSEFISRIQPKYLDQYRDCIFWYVHKREAVTIMKNGEVWAKRFGYGEPVKLPWSQTDRFYVDPITNKLCRITERRRRKPSVDQ